MTDGNPETVSEHEAGVPHLFRGIFVDPQEERLKYSDIEPTNDLDRAIFSSIAALPEVIDPYKTRNEGSVTILEDGITYHADGRLSFGYLFDERRLMVDGLELILAYDLSRNSGDVYINSFEEDGGLAVRSSFSIPHTLGGRSEKAVRHQQVPPWNENISISRELNPDEERVLIELLRAPASSGEQMLELIVITEQEATEIEAAQIANEESIAKYHATIEDYIQAQREAEEHILGLRDVL